MKQRDVYVRLGKLGDDEDRLTDYEHWDKLGDKARFEAAWELVVQAFKLKGQNIDELRFQRTVENLVRKPH